MVGSQGLCLHFTPTPLLTHKSLGDKCNFATIHPRIVEQSALERGDNFTAL